MMAKLKSLFPIPRTPKRERMQLAKSELWVDLSVTIGEWIRETESTRDDVFDSDESWPISDIAKRYELTRRDMVKLLDLLAAQCERAADRAGYDRAWI